jgi:glyoxylase-like metal-dependent hydrolase (beta-lactamase superfamily II)
MTVDGIARGSGSRYGVAMRTVADGVHQISKGVNAFIVDGDEGVVLIDTGLPSRHGAIEAGLASIGRSLGDVAAILVTHAHVDHVGGAAALRGGTGAPVMVSAADAPAARGEVPKSPPPFAARVPFLAPVFRLVPSGPPVVVDREVDEGVIEGLPEDLRVVATPGHTVGHVSYLLARSGGVMFVGDAAVRTRSGTVARGWMNRSTPVFDASVGRIAREDFSIACFGHSAPIEADAASAFRRCTEATGV